MEFYQAAPLKYRFKQPFWLGLALVVLFSFLRYSEDIFSNETWAEESTDFLVDELFKDIGVFTPAASTLFVLERIFAKLGLAISPLYAPAIIHFQCFVVYALVSAYFSCKSFRWLVPSDLLRIMASILITLAPGSNEVIANIPCLPYVIAFGLALTLVEDPRLNKSRSYRIFFVLAWIIGTLSSHISSALLPLSLVRAFYLLRRREKIFDDLSEVNKEQAEADTPAFNISSLLLNRSFLLMLTLPIGLTIANLGFHTFTALQNSYQITTPVINPPLVIARAIVCNFLTTAILAVVSGFPSTFSSSLVTIWDIAPMLVGGFSSSIFLGIFYALWRSRRYLQSHLGMGIFIAIWFLFSIQSVARGVYLLLSSNVYFAVSYRHFWLPYALSLVTILGPFLHWARGFSIKWGVYVLVMSAVCSSMLNISFTRQPKDVSWGRFIQQLESGATQATLRAIDDWAQITVFREGEDVRIHVEGGNR